MTTPTRILALAAACAAISLSCSPTTPDNKTSVFTSQLTSQASTVFTSASTTSISQTTIANTTVGVTSTMNWSLVDGCNDGFGMQVKLFDVTNNLVWPNATQVYVSAAGGTVTAPISCSTNAKICYGARRDRNPPDGTYWGVDVDGSKGCDNCCYSCANTTVALNLTCS